MTYYIIGIIVAIVIILALRPVYLWYWRVDDIIKLLEEQKKSNEQIAFILGGKQRSEIKKSTDWSCPKCNSINSDKKYSCEHCGYSLV